MQSLRILHITDLHLRGRWQTTYDDLVRGIEMSQPDLLLFTGDFVDNKKNHLPALPHLFRLLEGFRARLGCFGILGNHDRYALAPKLAHNVRLIDSERILLPIEGGTIELIGLPGVDRRDLTTAFVESIPPRDQQQPGTVRIVLSHFPDHLLKTQSLRPDLFLAGHTHGGQICLPGMVPILRHDQLPRKLCSGIHKVGHTWLIVNRGIGTTGLTLRVFCPPEALEVRLVREGEEMGDERET